LVRDVYILAREAYRAIGSLLFSHLRVGFNDGLRGIPTGQIVLKTSSHEVKRFTLFLPEKRFSKAAVCGISIAVERAEAVLDRHGLFLIAVLNRSALR